METWFARRYPKLAKYADIKPPKPTLTGLEALSGLSPQDARREQLKARIAAGENEQVEFKSTLRYCLKQKSPQAYVEHAALKTLAAFLNSAGGVLFLGVGDDGALLGLQPDYGSFKDSNKQDALRKHLDNLVANYLGNQYARYLHVEFAAIEGKEICVVEVQEKASEPVFLKNKQKGNQEEFYVRRFASTVALTPREAWQYQKEHWD
ncbi:MAG: helix-turn-helix domain-containing protein [bacterium]